MAITEERAREVLTDAHGYDGKKGERGYQLSFDKTVAAMLAFAAETSSSAASDGLREAWQRVSDEFDHIEGGMHADLEDAASALWDAFAALTASGEGSVQPDAADRQGVEALRSLSDAATAGPWKVFNLLHQAFEVCKADDYARGGVCVPHSRADADFIVAAVNYLRLALASAQPSDTAQAGGAERAAPVVSGAGDNPYPDIMQWKGQEASTQPTTVAMPSVQPSPVLSEGEVEREAFKRGAEAMQRLLADALRDHLNSRAAAIANGIALPEYRP